jgi:hypothetical protein
MIDGILFIELCHCFEVSTVNADIQFLIDSQGSMVVFLLTFGEISTAVQGRSAAQFEPRARPSTTQLTSVGSGHAGDSMSTRSFNATRPGCTVMPPKRFAGLAGLRSKLFSIELKSREARNVYIWDGVEAARAFFTAGCAIVSLRFMGYRPSSSTVKSLRSSTMDLALRGSDNASSRSAS